jgi:hypothetical protein
MIILILILTITLEHWFETIRFKNIKFKKNNNQYKVTKFRAPIN